MMEAHIKQEPPPLAGLRPELSARMLALVGKLMKKDPDERYRSFEELLTDLELLRMELESQGGTAASDALLIDNGLGTGVTRLSDNTVGELHRREVTLTRQNETLRRMMGVMAVALALALAALVWFFVSGSPNP